MEPSADPEADAAEAKRLYGITFNTMDDVKDMDAVIMAVCHKEFAEFKRSDIDRYYNTKNSRKILMDLKGMYDMEEYNDNGYLYWRL